MEIIESVPGVQEYVDLRVKAGLSAKSLEAAGIGLPNSLYAVQFRLNSELIAMGRVIGDGGCFFQIVDIAVDPLHQGQGLGRRIMAHIEAWLRDNTSEGAYVSLIGDQPGFYEKLGYKLTAPEAYGMYKRF